MAQVGTLTVDLIAQTASFNSNIEKAAANLNTQSARMNRSLTSVQKNVAAMRAEAEGLALGLAIKQAASWVKTNLDLAGSLSEVAQQVGVTTRELQVYRAIGGQLGVTQEDIDRGLSKLTVSLGQAALGAQAQGTAFTALGVSVRDASGQVRGTGAVLGDIADKLSKVKDPASRAAVEIQLFGEAGQKLDTVMTGGRAGIAAYAREAERMGGVLSDAVINQAAAASKQIAQLNTELNYNITNAVAQNAGAILDLAKALTKVTIAALGFVSNYPRLASALAGAAAGARFGLPGAVIGGGAGFVGSSVIGKVNADGNMDLAFRRDQLNRALKDYNAPKASGGGGLFSLRRQTTSGFTDTNAEKELRRQTALTQQATAQLRARTATAALSGVDLPQFKLPGGSTPRGGGARGGTPRTVNDRSAENLAQFLSDRDRLNDDLLRATRDNLTDVVKIAAYDRQMIEHQASQLDASIEADVVAGKLTRAQANELEQVNHQVKEQKLISVDIDLAEKQRRSELDLLMAANDNQKDLVQAQASLALTAAERQPLALRLLELDKTEERLRLEAIKASETATATQKAIAQARLDQLDTIYAAREQGVRRDTQGPLGSYIDSIPATAAQIDERVQGLVVDELEAVRHGIDDALTSALGIKDPLLAGIIDLFVQTQIIQPLAAALQNAQGSGGGGLGGLIGLGASLLGGGISGSTVARLTPDATATIAANLPLFANGTPSAPRGLAIVGERGPEVVRFGGGEQVVPNHRLGAMAFSGRSQGGARFGDTHFHFGPGTDPRMARESGAQAGRALRRELNGPLRRAG